MLHSEEDKQLVKLFSEQGMLPYQIYLETGVPENTIKTWRRSWGHSSKNNYNSIYSGTIDEVKERLIKIMQDAPKVSYTYFNSKDSGTPAATVYRKYFGSWEKAKEAAGITTNYTMVESRATILYLVEFEGYYKIGITQQNIHARLGARYPKYEIVLQVQFSSLKEAKHVEKEWLSNVVEYQYIPFQFPAEGRGSTECFKF